MKINASISILGDESGVRIEVEDTDASITFLNIFMEPKKFIQAALGRLSNTHCLASVQGLDKVGKKMEHKVIEFPMPFHNYQNRILIAQEEAEKECPEGWKPDLYFKSRDSFFLKDGKDGETWASCTIRRWV